MARDPETSSGLAKKAAPAKKATPAKAPIQGPPSGVKGSAVPARPTKKAAPKNSEPAFGSQGVITAQHPDPNVSTGVYAAIELAAKEEGVPLALALAMAQQESGFNANSVGDGGTSFGLYQLHKGGELTSAGLTPEQAFDPYTNAKVSLKVVASVMRQHPNWSWGQIAAAAQRPKDATGYANSVNGILSAAQKDPSYFVKRATGATKGTATVPAGATTGTAGTGGAGTSSGAVPAQYAPDSKVSIETYSYIAALAKREPDLANLMKKYAGEDLSNASVVQRLQADIQNTNWWKTHDDAYRTGEILKAQNPGQYQQNVEDQYAAVRKLSQDYLVPMSQATVNHWADAVASGRISQDDFLNYVKEQAKSLFPSLSHAIDSGVTVAQYADPYKQIAAQTLEIDPESVQFMDPKWNKALFQIDPKTGARTAMTLNDWTTTLKSDPSYGYAKTHQANQQAAAFGNSLAQTFGKIA